MMTRQNKQSNAVSNNSADQPARLQLIRPARKTGRFARSIVGLNHDVKNSVKRVFLESDFDITSLTQVARICNIRGPKLEPQRKVREILREAFFDQMYPPNDPSGRRAA